MAAVAGGCILLHAVTTLGALDGYGVRLGHAAFLSAHLRHNSAKVGIMVLHTRHSFCLLLRRLRVVGSGASGSLSAGSHGQRT
jgi:hypothetical protein